MAAEQIAHKNIANRCQEYDEVRLENTQILRITLIFARYRAHEKNIRMLL